MTEVVFERHCPRCHVKQPITNFPLNKSRYDGRGVYCRPCHAAIARERRSTPEGRLEHKVAVHRSMERGKARYAEAVAKLAPADRAKLGLA